MNILAARRKLAWDWYDGTIPQNVSVDDSAYVETTYSFLLYRSELPQGLRIGRGSTTYLATELNVSKPTLINWSRQFQFEIHNLRSVETEALAEKRFTSERIPDKWVSSNKRLGVGMGNPAGKNVCLLDSRLRQ
jgi:hypothetical protein